ncbi:MAG TPA: hypothetical protein VIB48_22355 [Acidimicrobiia bacterium]
MAVDDVAGAVERGDLDELIRLVDGLCAQRSWDALVELRDRCLRAVERGKQLWPAAHHAEYRLALEAPGPWAASVLVEGAGRFALGPLSEVVASTHTWTELAPHVPDGPVGVLAAHERVVRGEDLRAAGVDTSLPVLELPLVLEPWEPAYAVAHYRAHTVDFPSPAVPSLEPVELTSAEKIDDPAACDALRALAVAWTVASDGRSEAVAVQGCASDAVGALGARRARIGAIDTAGALAHMAWTAASGGAYGRRRGAATGRFDACLTAATLVGLDDPWPPDPGALGDAIDALGWYLWDAGEPVTGWSLHLAVEDPARGIAWALAATDAR